MKAISSRDDYYFDGTCFVLQSKFFKRFKVGILAGLAAGFLFFTNTDDTAYATILEKIDREAKPPVQEIALINYISTYNKEDAKSIVASVNKWAEHFKLDPLLLLAIAYTESHFDRTAISSAGAMGVMQILTKWHIDKLHEAKKVVGDPSPFNIETSIFLGSWVFKDCSQKFSDLKNQLRCYNGSVGMDTTYDGKVLTNMKKLKEKVSDLTDV